MLFGVLEDYISNKSDLNISKIEHGATVMIFIVNSTSHAREFVWKSQLYICMTYVTDSVPTSI